MTASIITILIRLFVFFLFWFLIDLYVYQAVKVITASIEKPFLRNGIRTAYWLADIIIAFFILYIFLSHSQNKGVTLLGGKVFAAVILFFVPKFFFITPFMLLEDITRLFASVIKWISNRGNTHFHIDSRRKFVSQIALGIAAIPFLGILHGITKGKYNFRVLRETLYFPDLPDAFDGFTITQVSDIHSGSFDNFDEVKRGVEMIDAEKSDLLVFTGDMVNNLATEAEPYVELFKGLSAPHGKYSIYGNHDYGDYIKWNSVQEKENNLKNLAKIHQRMGFKLMLNENVSLSKNNQNIRLLGIENWGLPPFPQKGDLKAALQGVEKDEFKILLSHDPSHFEEQVKKHDTKIHLTLSGHTHGMQFGIEIPGFKWSPVKFRYPRWAGLYTANGRYLYVNRGFGFLVFPGRVGIWPEITVITLKKGNHPGLKTT